MRKALATLVAACLALSSRNSPPAENCPTHALITIVPFPTDGPTDALARDLGWRMRPIPGQPVHHRECGGCRVEHRHDPGIPGSRLASPGMT